MRSLKNNHFFPVQILCKSAKLACASLGYLWSICNLSKIYRTFNVRFQVFTVP